MKNFINKVKELFNDRKKRHITTLICFVPIIALMLVFSINAYKNVKSILTLVKDDVVLVSNDHRIDSMGYTLRDNETSLQMELFTNLKNAVEGSETTDEEIAKLVAMNFICDFYTWSNKAGQYDVGGIGYIDKVAKEPIYTMARDGFYKYINEYMEKYGSENLLEVETIEASVTQDKDPYPITRVYKYDIDEYQQGEEYITTEYSAYTVEVKWTYKESERFSTDKFQKSASITVINNIDDGRFEVVNSENKGVSENA